ncbi:MAG: 5'/3'-nucleotidase SurE [Polyangiaceae bacterium]|nr:5'/3'-nucleotidase SurE [Polyangiaceae bacterium]
MADRPLLLLTNDDGYQAEGLRALREALGRLGEVIVVAPETEQSATSHSLSLHRPLRLRRVENGVFALDGTPADCVYVALNGRSGALPRRPDLVVSGLNHGVNLGYDVFYSGTVGAAREAALRGVRALATSADMRASRPAAAALATDVARALLAQPRQSATPLLNLNVPPGEGPWRLRTTVLGSRVYDDEVTVAFDPRGREYMWIGGGGVTHPEALGSDTEAFDAGEASLTPLVLDLSAFGQTEFCRTLVSSISQRPESERP